MRHAVATTLAAALSATVLLSACGGEDSNGPTMRPGEDCLGCHTGGETPAFVAAGTVARAAGVSGLTVTVTVDGTPRSTTTNSVGNFYLSGSGTVSAASINGTAMPGGSGITGHCNHCHGGGVAVP